MPALNMDVMATVCAFLTNVSDILSFGLTCSSLRHIANKRLLDSRTIDLTESNAVRKFHSFLFADADARTPHIHALKLNLSLRRPPRTPHQSDDCSILFDIITSCPRLDHIIVFFGDWYSDTQHSRLIDTIAAIPSLRSLSVYASITEGLALLHDARAPLRMVSVHCSNPPGNYWYPAALENTLDLPRLAPTLEKLELAHFVVDRAGIQALCNVETPPVFDMMQYPVVRSLSIDWFMREPRLDHLQHLFPALDGALSLGKLDASIPKESYDQICSTNQVAQRSTPSRAWNKLDRVRVCDAPMLYVLGLTCPIRLVILDYPSSYTNFHCAREALRENPVPRLKLSSTFGLQVRIIDELLSPELARTLTHLTVCFVYSNGDGPWPPEEAEAFAQLQWEDFLGEFLSALQPLQKLTHLRVVIHATLCHGASWAATHSQDFIDAIHGSAFDFDGTVAAFARPLPSLQFIALDTSGYVSRLDPEQNGMGSWKVSERWNVTQAYRVAAQPGAESDAVQGGEPVLVALHEEVAETVIRKEELGLSETDKLWLHQDV
ncbi:hypothetical protein V8D89_012950 [Ganoderma adspersum]